MQPAIRARNQTNSYFLLKKSLAIRINNGFILFSSRDRAAKDVMATYKSVQEIL